MTTTETLSLRESTPETLGWQRAEDAEAQRLLHTLPGYQRLLGMVAARQERRRVAVPVRRGERWFQLVDVDDIAEQPVLAVGSALGAVDRVLVDPNVLTNRAGVPVTLLLYAVSASGRYVAYARDTAGVERTSVHVVDADTGEELAEDLPYLLAGVMTWVGDEGFWLAARIDDPARYEITLHFHRLGQPAAPAEDLPGGLLFPVPAPSVDGRWVVARCGNTEVRAERLRGPDGRWRPFLADPVGGSIGTVVGDDYIAILDGEHPHGRLVRIPLSTYTDRTTWTELLPAGEVVLRQVHHIRDDLIVVPYLRDAAVGLLVMRTNGNVVDDIAMPGRGNVSIHPVGDSHTQLLDMVAPDGDGFTFVFSSLASSPAAYRWSVERGLTLLIEPDQRLNGIQVDVIRAVSADGTVVPAHVVRRADLTGQALPTLLHGYGGFNIALVPAYSPDIAAWVAAGGAYVIANLRGGCEYGRTWFLQGRMEHKQNCFDDLYAVADVLRSDGIAGRLAVWGKSNGGLLTGVAVTQRPELWDAVVSEIPLFDLLDLTEPLTLVVVANEYGNPADPQEREWLARYSPLQNIGDGTAYPPLLVVSGENDPRCPAWHGRVFIDAIRRASSSGAPALLRVRSGQGHGALERSSQAGSRRATRLRCGPH